MSVHDPRELPKPGKPEIAFAGRSNAVNMVLGQDALTKTLESGVTTVRSLVRRTPVRFS